MLDTQWLAHKHQIWQAKETTRQTDLLIQDWDRTLQRAAEGRKRSDALDLEWRRTHDEANEMLKKLGYPPLDPLPPLKPRPPG